MKLWKIVTAALFITASIAGTQIPASANNAVSSSQKQQIPLKVAVGHWSYGVLDDVLQTVPAMDSAIFYGIQPNTGMSRYEMAVAVARLINRIGNEPEKFQPQFRDEAITRFEMIDAIFALCMEYEIELKMFGAAGDIKWMPKHSRPLYKIAAPK